MKLDQFVEESLKQIINGVRKAAEYGIENHALVNPTSATYNSTNVSQAICANTGIPLQKIEFDLALTINESNTSSEGGSESIGAITVAGNVVEADIKGFFDNIDHDWLIKMLELRIDDKAFIGLIKQWLKSRVRQLDGSYIKPEKGTPQGGVISPVRNANIYLHYALDLWFSKKVKPRMTGNCMLIRYTDDFVVAFQYKDDADRFYRGLPKRLSKFGLSIAPEKTRLIKFNQFRPGRERHFNFLGFEFYWDQDNGKSQLRRRTARSKLKQVINEMKDWIRRYRSVKLNKLMPLYKRKLIGYQNYFGLPDNSVSLNLYSRYAFKALFKWLNRRSQRRSYNWVSFREMLRCYGVHGLRVRNREYLAVDWY